MKDKRLALLVGHCMPDSFGLTRLITRSAPGTKAVRVNSDQSLNKHLDAASLLLVNRQLDGRFSVSMGVDLIAALRVEGITTPMMLVSNYPEAQASAVHAGALPGFGKQDLRDRSVADRLKQALDSGAPGQS